MKKRIVFSSLREQSEITQTEFRKLSPIERLRQLRKDIERLYFKELQSKRNGKIRIIVDEYIP